MKQQTLSDMEYSCRKKKTKREEFLEQMDRIIPWGEWIALIQPCYNEGERGNKPYKLESVSISKNQPISYQRRIERGEFISGGDCRRANRDGPAHTRRKGAVEYLFRGLYSQK